MSLTPWFAVAIATTLINGITLGFIGARERNRKLRSWAWAWGVWALAALPLLLMQGSGPPGALLAVACGTLWVLSTLLFLRGCYQLAQRAMPRGWLLVSGAAVGLALSLGVGARGELGMGPLVLFQCVGLIASGVLLIRQERGRLGAWMAGSALGLLGLHVLDAPLLASHAALMPWGFVIATALQVLAALGMVTLYYEKARDRVVETELALERHEHIRALGRAAGSVAHDFNNLLTIMQCEVDLFRSAKTTEDARASVDSLQNAIEQSRRFTKLLLTVGQSASLRLEEVDLGQVTQCQLDLLASSLPDGVTLSFRAPETPVLARVDRALIEQIVLNLVTNARDALASGGRIEVELVRSEASRGQVVLRVKDTGPGITEEIQKRIFEPFFTTKREGKGTGLGLASVQGAVSQLGGSVRVHSAPLQGSCFEVLLPL